MLTVYKSFIFYTLVGRIFPIYAALNAIKERNHVESMNWLCFYIFSEVWWIVEKMLWFLLRLVPMYDLCRAILLIAALLVTTGYSPIPLWEAVGKTLWKLEQNWPTIRNWCDKRIRKMWRRRDDWMMWTRNWNQWQQPSGARDSVTLSHVDSPHNEIKWEIEDRIRSSERSQSEL